MLDPAKGIASVTLQEDGLKGLDDVVVRFANGESTFVQVKHTRSGNTLTFGDLVGRTANDPPLLLQISTAWSREDAFAPGKVTALLVTNRAVGTRSSVSRAPVPVPRPPLEDFLAHLHQELKQATDIASIMMPAEWRNAWTEEWLAQLSPLQTAHDSLRFLRSFRIEARTEGLDTVNEGLLTQLESTFAVTRHSSVALRGLLDSSLRIWATTLRQKRRITTEDVYEALCLTSDQLIGDHEIAPPAPFFPTRLPLADRVTHLLQSRTQPIIFLVGEPGSGKTALLSFLAARREPVIDIRFHAYRPITPENRLLPSDAAATTTARALWSDLLLQLRTLCKGRFATLRPPVHAGSLSVDALRSHVLRLGDTIGREQQRPFVIAIDGIDHAARSGSPTEAFLASLVPPESIPPNVVFLIGGQPPEAYASYPLWLRISDPGVIRCDLPRLELRDTLTLVQKRLPAVTTYDHDNIANAIWQRCLGHPLSTVFAVEEAAMLHDQPMALARRLDATSIASGVEAYYNHIWNAATRYIAPTATPARLAACLCLLPVRADGLAVRAALGSAVPLSVDLNDILRDLRPLVVEENGGFRVFHNDVRVFLQRLLQADAGIYRECASRLADFLLQSRDRHALHAAAQNLLGISGRVKDQAALFTPYYVLEGHVLGQSLDELSAQGVTASEAICATSEDWDLVHQVGTALQTLSQLRTSLELRQTPPALKNVPGPLATVSAERCVVRQEGWTEAVLHVAFDDIASLAAFGEHARAKATWERWFAGAHIKDLVNAVLGHGTAPDSPGTSDSINRLLTKAGLVSGRLGVYLTRYPPDAGGQGEADFATGLFQAMREQGKLRSFLRIQQHVHRYYSQDAERIVAETLQRREWGRCKALLRMMRPSHDYPLSCRLVLCGAAMLLADHDLRESHVLPLISDPQTLIANAVASRDASGPATQVMSMSWAAFILGFEAPSREAAGIREAITDVYYASSRDDRTDDVVAQLLHAAALLGSWVCTTSAGTVRAAHVRNDTVASVLASFLGTMQRPAYVVHEAFGLIAPSLVRGIDECSRSDAEIGPGVRTALYCHLQSGQWSELFLDTAWHSLARDGAYPALVAYADSWIGPGGRAWREPTEDRQRIVTRLATLLEGIDELARAQRARKVLPWGDIGYSSHKEYALRQPLDWFQVLANRDAHAWSGAGLRLLAVSREASRAGDNRVSWDVEEAVLATTCIHGPASLARLTGLPNASVGAKDHSVVCGLLRMAERVSLPSPDLLAIWAFCTGKMCWQVRHDRERLVEARDQLLKCKGTLAAEMERIAAAEFLCEHDARGDGSAVEPQRAWLKDLGPSADFTFACKEHDWSGLASALERLNAERDQGSAQAIELAWRTLGEREDRDWHYDGASAAYEALIPLLSPERRWDAVRRAVARGRADIPSHRCNALAQVLDDMCRRVASKGDIGAARRGLERLLEMHELWTSGAGHLGTIVAIPIAAETRVGTWREILLDLLMDLLSFDEQSYVQSALRGVYRSLALDGTLFPRFAARVRAENADVQRRVLFAAESLAQLPGADAFCDWLAEQVPSARLDMGLHAWCALRTSFRAMGKPPPTWPEPSEAPPLLYAAATPLIDRPVEEQGLYQTAGRASSRILSMLQTACEESVMDLRVQLAASVKGDPPVARSVRRRDVRVGDMVYNPGDEAETDRLFVMLATRERQGRFRGVPVERLAQALLPCVDPCVFLRTPTRWLQSMQWPVDKALDELI
ncbi:MAG: AAA family ATPase [Planctomycetes bacterium]|nr:AAA family ATPase [Planctomycetota bacterium]